jgi:hypothetical protein
MSSSPVDLRRRLLVCRKRECEVSWCKELTHGLSKHCATHRSRRRSTGDPQGSTLRRTHVRSHANKAKTYLLANRGHKAIEAGLGWASSWLTWGHSYSSSWQGLSPTHQARQYLHRLRGEGIHEADVLATIIAVIFIRQYEPGAIRSDAHFRFQTIAQVLGLASWPSEGGNGKTRKRYFRPTPKAVEVLWQSIPSPILVLAHSIATKIEEEQRGPGVDTDALKLPLPLYTKEIQ